jgi:hypothetical protein
MVEILSFSVLSLFIRKFPDWLDFSFARALVLDLIEIAEVLAVSGTFWLVGSL